jgi:hypothetical protein
LRLRGLTIGALNFFGARPDVLALTDLRLGQALTDVAAIGIRQERMIDDRDMLAEQR